MKLGRSVRMKVWVIPVDDYYNNIYNNDYYRSLYPRTYDVKFVKFDSIDLFRDKLSVELGIYKLDSR